MIVVVLGSIIVDQQYAQDNKQSIQIKIPQAQKFQVLGSTSKGKVTKSGPYGNPNSTRKIAFIVGVHPMEVKAHMAVVGSILALSKSLNRSYYIYDIDVTKDRNSYDKGRRKGQALANKYAVPDIEKSNFQLVIDIHSNRGKYTGYKKNRFLAVPINDKRSKSTAYEVINKIPWLVYYIPPKWKGPSSPKYVTIPLINSGVPSIVYETYMYEPYETTSEHANEFIMILDNVKLK